MATFAELGEAPFPRFDACGRSTKGLQLWTRERVTPSLMCPWLIPLSIASAVPYLATTATRQELPTAAEMKSAAVDWARVTAEPRRYGFNATLKAPFHLSSACTETQLVSAFDNFANIGHAVPMITPTIEMLSGFAAIVPLQRKPPVDALAIACTTLFDAFRAPMTPQERARRVASGLSHSEMQNLDRWGYPFLFSDFRFHMALTGTIQTRQHGAVLAVLRERFQSMCGDQPIAIDRLALVKQETSHGAFRVVSHTKLRATR